MLLLVFGLAVTIVATYFVNKTAREYGRNVTLWTLLTLGVGLGGQIVLPFILGVVLVIIFMVSGTRDAAHLQQKTETPAFYINIFCLLASFAAMWIVLRYVSRLPEDPDVHQPPPPPEF
jgi:hypothetical protein